MYVLKEEMYTKFVPKSHKQTVSEWAPRKRAIQWPTCIVVQGHGWDLKDKNEYFILSATVVLFWMQ